MSDIEEQVGASLAAAAEGAPDAGGLAAGARRRHRVRRQRRIAVGGVAAALVVAVSAVAIGTRGGERNDLAEDPTETPSAASRTIASGAARAEIPADWKAFECGAGPDAPTNYGPADSNPCSADRLRTFWMERPEGYSADEAGKILEGRDEQDAPYWLGSVSAGNRVLVVGTADADLTRQILASARLNGQPLVDGSSPWVGFSRGVITYDIPAWWGVGEDGDRSGYSTCVAIDHTSRGLRLAEQVDPQTYVLARPFDGKAVTVTAPTQAVAQLVMATVVHYPMVSAMGDCSPEDFNVGLLPPEGSAGAPVEGEESAPAGGSVAADARSFAADLEERYATEGEYPIDESTVESLIEDGELVPLPDGYRLSTFWRLTRERGFLFCLVREVSGDYAAYDSTNGGVVGEGTVDPARGDGAVDEACIEAINNG